MSIDTKHLKIDTFRASMCITHVPTGITVEGKTVTSKQLKNNLLKELERIINARGKDNE